MTTDLPPSLASLVKQVLPKHMDISSAIEQFNENFTHELDELLGLRDSGASVIPEVPFSELQQTGLSSEQKALIRKRGCVIVRGVVDEAQADTWNNSLEQYLTANRYYEDLQRDVEQGSESRAKHPVMLDVYWSVAQVEIRQAKPLQIVRQQLNSLWQVDDVKQGSFNPNQNCTYADRVRIRQAGDEVHGLAPHVDSCSLESWFSSATIWNTYKHLLDGSWAQFSAFDARNRVSTSAKPHSNACGMFRTYQSWMALTKQGANSGTLQLVPSSRCVAWLFLNMLKSSMENQPIVFPETGRAYVLDEVAHQPLSRGLCSMPDMHPGDTVWWHPDVVHGVEYTNRSTHSSNVVYLGSAPNCARNTDYLQQQYKTFDAGLSPPDFPNTDIEAHYSDRASPASLTGLGRLQMGMPVT